MLGSCLLQRIDAIDVEIKQELDYIKHNFKDVITYKVGDNKHVKHCAVIMLLDNSRHFAAFL